MTKHVRNGAKALALAVACLGGCAAEVGSGRDASGLDAGEAVDAPAVSADDVGLVAEADANVPDAARLGPPYPVVLAHGFFGFEDFAGLDFATYFYEVKDDLASSGETLVFTPAVDPFNDSTTRGEQLLAQIEAILAETGHERVNLVGHSQGGLDARVVAALRPDLIASVTTVATPHRGSRVADVLLGVVADPQAAALTDAFVRLVSQPLYDAAGHETSLVASLRQLSTEGAAELDAAYPMQPGIPYFSIAGRSDRADAADLCVFDANPTFLRRWNDERDPLDALLTVSGAIVGERLLNPVPNDGLVSVESAQYGTFLGCVPADHLDEIGHLFGDSPGLGNDFDHWTLYREIVRFLRARGL